MKKFLVMAAVLTCGLTGCKGSGSENTQLTRLTDSLAFDCFTVDSCFVEQQESKELQGGHLVADRVVCDAGTFPRSESQRDFTFMLRNTGSSPMRIFNVEVSCGCMNPTYPTDEFGPGQEVTLTIHYDGHDKVEGEFEKGLTVVSSADNAKLDLKIKGNMLP